MSLSWLAKNSRYTVLVLILLQLSQAAGGSVRVGRAVNGRTSANFRGTANIKTLVPEGTEGDVLEKWALPSGNFGIKMRVTALSSKQSTSKLKIGEELWVYYHLDKNLRLVELYDDDKQAVAVHDFQVTGVKQDSPACESCTTDDPTITIPVSHLASQIIESVQDVPTIDLGVEEIVTFLNKTRYQPDTNRRIARAVLKEAKDNNVSVPFILGVIFAESAFKQHPRDAGAGAMGLMQLEPAAWASVMGKNVPRTTDIELNIRAGVRYLAGRLKLTHGDEALALYAYKNGDANLDKYLRGERGKSKSTKIYEKNVKEVQANYLAYQAHTGTMLASN